MKIKLVLILLILSFYIFKKNVVAQDFTLANYISGSGNIRINETVKLDDGIVLFGDFLGTTSRPETIVADSRDIFLAEYDDNYNHVWSKHIGGTLIDLAQDITTDLENNIYILGSFQGTCSFDGLNELTSDGNYDVFIAKYTNTGNFVWAKKIAYNTATQYGSSIDFDGTNLIIGGYYKDSINFDSQSFLSTYGMYYAKIDMNGVFIWAKNIPTTSSSSTLQSVSIFSDGYYFNGRFRGTAAFDLGDYVSNNPSYTDVFLYKTDFNGVGNWVRRTYGDANSFTGTMTQDSYGNIYYTGLFGGTSMEVDSTSSIKGGNAIVNNGGSDIFILKYNKNGTLIWAKDFGLNGSDWARDIKFENKVLYLTGYFSDSIIFDNDTLKSSSLSDIDAFIGVFDNKGNILKATKIDDSNDNKESGMTISVDSENNIFWGGTFKSNSILVGDSSFINPNPGKQCVFITKGKAFFSVAFSNTNNSTCYQSDDGELIVTPYLGKAPYSYTWSHNGSLNDSTATGLAAGTYTVTVKDALDSTAIATYELTEPDAITFNAGITNVVSCSYSGEGAINLNVSGGNGGYDYQWVESAGGYGSVLKAEDQSSLLPGTYSVTVTDSKYCTDDTTIIITGPAPITFGSSAVTDSSSSGSGIIDLEFTGGTGMPSSFTFDWQGPSGSHTYSEDTLNLSPGNYNVTVTDINSCDFDTTFNVANLDTFYIYISDYKDACNGVIDGNATVSYRSPDSHTNITYLWDGNAGNQTTATAINLASGRYYSVTVTDVENVPDIVMVDSVYISALTYTFDGQISVLSTSALDCFGDNDGFIDLTITSEGEFPYTYNWSNASTTQDITGLSTGMYSVTATDENGCSFSVTNYNITQPTVLAAVAEIVQSPTCNGNFNGEVTVDRSGGTSPYTYQWDDPGYQSTRNADGLDAGYYTVTVTDVNSCTATSGINLTEPDAIDITKLVNNEICNSAGDGSVSLTVTGGTIPFTYFWTTTNGSGLNVTSKNQSGLTAGNYYFTVTDDNNCTYEDSVEITEPSLITITNEEKTNISTCYGESTGTITITASGGTGLLTYTLNPGAIQTNNDGAFTGISAGTYTVDVEDANSCGPITSGSIEITEPDIIDIAGTLVNNVVCNGEDDGSIDITVTGGTYSIGYTYNWATTNGSGLAAGLQDQPALGAGTYDLTVTDDNSCEETRSFSLTEPGAIDITKTVYDLSCSASTDGVVIISVTGGVLPFSYFWSTPNGSGLIPTNKNQGGLGPGTYYLFATDGSSCIVEDTVGFTLPPSITIDTENSTDASGATNADGTVTVEASGGTGTLTYTLQPDNTSNQTGVFSTVLPGDYTVEVTDINLCGPVTSGTITVGSTNAIWETNISDNIKIYPNPTSAMLYVEADINVNNNLTVEIINVSGVVIYRKEIIKSDGIFYEKFDLGNFSKGVYFIRVYNNQVNYNGKILLQ